METESHSSWKTNQTNKQQNKKLKWIFFHAKRTISGELNNEAITELPTIEADQITRACKARLSLEPVWWERNSVPDSL